MTDLAHVNERLSESYALERELGGAGLSRVFVAQERALNRKVVVKMLPPDVASGISVERFAREIQLAAGLQHPNIVPLLSAGDVDGVPFYTMPYIEGESLRARMARDNQVTVLDAVRIAGQVADALVYAHERGVVHRDIKPENILLSSGHALVADFGIAKAIDTARAPTNSAEMGGFAILGTESATLTELGVTLGTPTYMSPEQAAGDATLDARTDVYSLGAVLYEMLAGQPPFVGPNAAAVIAKRFTEKPPPLRSFQDTLPAVLERAIDRALALSPNDRFTTAAEFAKALADSVIELQRVPKGDERPSIAVLPFANLSPDPENEYFSDGVAEEILSALGRLQGLHVASRTSSFAFKNKNVDLRSVAQQLGVRTVLEGSVRKSGNRMRITAQLINADNGYHIWSERYDRELSDVFAIQDEIASAIARVLEVKLVGDGAEKMADARQTQSVEAYTLVLHGRYFLARRGPALFEAIEHLERAIELAPDYAPAYASLADAYAFLGTGLLMTPGSAFRRSREAAEQALALDAGRSDAHATLSLVALLHDWDRPNALAHAERAIAIDPNYSDGHARQAVALVTMRRFDEAVRACERARSLDPLSPAVLFNLALCYFYAGRYADQLATAKRAVELSPLMPDAHRMVAAALFWSGKPQDAIAYVERIIDTVQRNSVVLSDLAGYLGAMGRATEARAVLAEVYRRSATEPVQWVWIAFAHAMLGNVEEMSVALRRALDARDFWIFTLDLDTVWDAYRAEPRFAAVMEETGLA
jgi:serine/threonine-protein kinase